MSVRSKKVHSIINGQENFLYCHGKEFKKLTEDVMEKKNRNI